MPSRTSPVWLVVFLENGGRIEGVPLPGWAGQLVDWLSEEYAKLVIWAQARRHYDRIVVLEDEQATATQLWQTLVSADRAIVDLLMLVHGQEGYACGYGNHRVGSDFFEGMQQLNAQGLAPFNLRAVYQMNCYGETLANRWLALGAKSVNGSLGINWLPEPSLSIFLRHWLGGKTFGEAVARSYSVASRALGLAWRPTDGLPHPRIASSSMAVFGDQDLRIDSPDTT